MKLLTLDDYMKAGEEFFPKYYYVMGEMGEGAKPEDVLKVMEAVGGLALKMRLEKDGEVGPFGFNKKPKEEEKIPETDTATGIFEYPYVSDPCECEKYSQVGVKENGVWKCYDI